MTISKVFPLTEDRPEGHLLTEENVKGLLKLTENYLISLLLTEHNLKGLVPLTADNLKMYNSLDRI